MFRTEASSAIGNGHVMRCLAIAEQCISLGWNPVFVMHECPQAVAARLTSADITVYELPTPDSALTLQTLLDTLAPDAIVIDGYQFDAAYRKALSRNGVPIMAIDDGNLDFNLHADILLNSSPLANKAQYRSIAPCAELLLGPGYAPLRQEFHQLSQLALTAEKPVERILVSFGGSDPARLTLPTTQALRALLPATVQLDVVVGNAFSDQDNLASLENSPNIKMHYHCQQMAALMQQCHLAVTAAGSTLWELAFLGIPTIALVVADNQAVALQPPMNEWFVSIDARNQPDSAIQYACTEMLSLVNTPEKRKHHQQLLQNIGVGRHSARICQLIDDKIQATGFRHIPTPT